MNNATDKELAKKVCDAAWALARVMTEAGNAGLLIEMELKPHSATADTRRVYTKSDYRPCMSIMRIVEVAS